MMADREQFIERFTKGDYATLKSVYKKYFHIILSLIIKNGGQHSDAEDIFQESLVIIYENLVHNKLILKVNFGTYLYAVAKNRWLDRFKKKGREISITDTQDAIDYVDISSDVEEQIYLHERRTLYLRNFSKLSDSCKRILQLFFEGNSMASITSIMGFASDNYTRKRKFNCKERLVEYVKQDPAFNEISENGVIDEFNRKSEV